MAILGALVEVETMPKGREGRKGLESELIPAARAMQQKPTRYLHVLDLLQD